MFRYAARIFLAASLPDRSDIGKGSVQERQSHRMRWWRTAGLTALGSFAAMLAFGSPAYAACPTFTTFANGSPADATAVMGNFNYILQCPVFNGLVSLSGPISAPAWTLTGAQFSIGANSLTATTGSGTIALRVANSIGTPTFNSSTATTLTEAATYYIAAPPMQGTNTLITRGYDLYLDSAVTGESEPLFLRNLNGTGGSAVSLGFGVNGSGLTTGKITAIRLSGSNQVLTFSTFNGTLNEAVRIDASGNMGIGTTTPGQRLTVSGTIRQSGCVTAGTLSANTSGDIICTSDARLKNILSQYTGGLKELEQIVPQQFTYKTTKIDPVETFVHAGFIAQNVKAVIPQASALQPNGYYSLDTTAILAASVNAIKELKATNDREKQEIAKLKSAFKAAGIKEANDLRGFQSQQVRQIKLMEIQLKQMAQRLDTARTFMVSAVSH